MPKGYWIAHVDVADPQGYQAYMQANGAVFRKYGAKFVVRGGTSENVEGHLRARHVVLEFKDYATALACYHSDDYRTPWRCGCRIRPPISSSSRATTARSLSAPADAVAPPCAPFCAMVCGDVCER
jgi:uncharacterized protein (DUF1330 family)